MGFPEIVNKTQFNAVIGTLPSAILVTDKKGVIVTLNKQLEKLFGYQKTELLGKKIEMLLPEQYRKGHTGQRDSYYSDPHTRYMGVCKGFYAKRKDGGIVSVDIMLSPVMHKNELHVVSSIWDITKLEKTKKKLKETNEELNTFIYKSSHDLRAPLASILGLINVSEMEVKDPEALKYFNLIKDRILTQDAILAELLRVARIYEGKIRRELINPVAEISEIAASLKNSEEAAKINFKIKDKYKKKLTTDRMLFASIIQNLVTNAIKYRNAAIKKPGISIEVAGNGNGINITVKDNGIGIPIDIQPHIYKMFYRGNEDSKGSGLGLYIVKKAVDKLGGTIRLKSEIGKGSTFTILLHDMKES